MRSEQRAASAFTLAALVAAGCHYDRDAFYTPTGAAGSTAATEIPLLPALDVVASVVEGDVLFVFAVAHQSREPGYWIRSVESGR